MEANSNPYNNFYFFKNLVGDMYSLDKLYIKKQTSNENIKIAILEEPLRKELIWEQILGECYNFAQLKSWFESFQKSDITHPISNYLPGYSLGFINVKIYESELFHLTVHFKLSKKLTQTYNLLIFYSFWFERPSEFNELKLDYINSIYRDLVLGYKLTMKLQTLNYSQLSLFNIDSYDPGGRVNKTIKNSWISKKPLFFISLGLELLNANPFKLTDDLITHLNIIENFINESSKFNLDKDNQFMFDLSSELKDFLVKGRDLFLIAKDTLDYISKPEKNVQQETEIVNIEEKESKGLNTELFLSIFKKAFEKDKVSRISIEDCGFRSLSEIHNEFSEQFPFSKQTYYNCFKSLNLDVHLDKRERKKIGGGIEYRIRKKELIHEIHEEELNEVFMKEKMLAENALIHYNRGEINRSITIFEEFLNSPSIQLKDNPEIYFGSKFYLGKCYFKTNKYEKALEIFKDIHNQNDDLIEVSYYIIKIYSILHNYAELTKLLNLNINKIERIFKKYVIRIRKFGYMSDFVGKIKEGDDLTKFILFLNTDKIEKSFKQGILKNQRLNFYTKNDIACWKLIKLFKSFLKLNLELQRRLLFRAILENDINRIEEYINYFIELLNNENYRNSFDNVYILLYPHYIKLLMKSHFKTYDFKNFDLKIEKIFPGFISHTIPFNDDLTRKNLEKQESLLFSNEINKFRYISNKRYDSEENQIMFHDPTFIDIKKKLDFDDPEFVLEWIYTEAFYTYKYNVIEHILTEIKEFDNEILKKDIMDLFNLWENFTYSFNKYEVPNELMDRFKYAIKLCNESNLNELLVHFKKLYANFQPLVVPLNKKRIKIKKGLINKMFQILSQSYAFQEREKISLDFKDLSGNTDDIYFDMVYPKIQEILDKHKKHFKLEIFLPSKEVAELANNFFDKHSNYNPYILFNSLIVERTSETNLIIKNKSNILYNEKNEFGDNMIIILKKILDLIKNNYNKLIIKTNSFQNEDFFQKFTVDLRQEFQNNYFEFNIMKSLARSDEIEVEIINKK